MRRLRTLPYSIALLFAAGLLLYSCGPGKGHYTVDTLVANYAYETELETGIPSAQRETIDYDAENDLDSQSEEDIREEQKEEREEAEELKDNPKVEGSVEPAVEVKQGPRYHDRIKVRNIGRLVEVFNDSNYRQLTYAKALGIEPIKNLARAYNTRRPLLRIRSTADYTVDTLTHSLPYLVPEASRLLTAIGRNFKDSLRRRGADGYRVRVTSLLRTPYSVKRLRKVNINSTDSSTHQFGTTFDLSYRRFHCLDTTRTINEEDLKNLLAEVLYDLREQGRCLVKYERKTGCFHVTVTR